MKVLLSAQRGANCSVNIVPFYGYIFHTIKCFDLLLHCRPICIYDSVLYDVHHVCLHEGWGAWVVFFLLLLFFCNNNTLCIDFTVICSLTVRRQRDKCSISCTVRRTRPLHGSLWKCEVQSFKLEQRHEIIWKMKNKIS